MVMLRFVTACDPAISNQELGLATFAELDCAYQPRCDPGHVSVRVLPLTPYTMFVGVGSTLPITVKTLPLKFHVSPGSRLGRFVALNVPLTLVALNSVKVSPACKASPTFTTLTTPPKVSVVMPETLLAVWAFVRFSASTAVPPRLSVPAVIVICQQLSESCRVQPPAMPLKINL